MAAPPKTLAIYLDYKDSKRNYTIGVYQTGGYCLGWVAEYYERDLEKSRIRRFITVWFKDWNFHFAAHITVFLISFPSESVITYW